MKIAPSILAADFSKLGEGILMLNSAADLIHLDVMDGTFVPNISFGFPVLEAVASNAKIPMDAHFMTVHPEKWVERTAALGVSMMSFHLEAAGRDTASIIGRIQEAGMKAGVVITVEPGVYLPGVGGVRIEDTCLVKENGCVPLTTADKQLIIL